jgi:hypothetical protein
MWRAPDISDLSLSLSQTELDAYSAAATESGETAEGLLRRGADLARGYLRASAAVRLGPAGTVPAALVAPLMDYLCVDVIKRLPLAVSEDRRRAREQALQLFRDAASGRYAVESADGPDEAKPGGGVELAPPAPGRITSWGTSGI